MIFLGKSQQQYEKLLTAIVSKADDMGFRVDPTRIVCDFELSIINAVSTVLGPHVSVQGCFYHLCQSTWRKIQDLGLTTAYKEIEDVKRFCGMLDALAFLPLAEVKEGLRHIYDTIPDVPGLQELLTYFDATYVMGTFRRIQRRASPVPLRLRPIPPLFNPERWNVFEATLAGDARTNNICESWNNAFSHLVGHAHPSVWRVIEAFQSDQALVSTAIIQNGRGQPPVKRIRRDTAQLQQRLHRLCCRRRDGDISIVEMLEDVAHTIRFH